MSALLPQRIPLGRRGQTRPPSTGWRAHIASCRMRQNTKNGLALHRIRVRETQCWIPLRPNYYRSRRVKWGASRRGRIHYRSLWDPCWVRKFSKSGKMAALKFHSVSTRLKFKRYRRGWENKKRLVLLSNNDKSMSEFYQNKSEKIAFCVVLM